jgi:hypothetical protein
VASAQLLVDDEILSRETAPGDTHATFTISLEQGEQVRLEGKFLDRKGNPLCGSFYTFLRRLDEPGTIPAVEEYVSPGTASSP